MRATEENMSHVIVSVKVVTATSMNMVSGFSEVKPSIRDEAIKDKVKSIFLSRRAMRSPKAINTPMISNVDNPSVNPIE